jgi:hypothetical protein
MKKQGLMGICGLALNRMFMIINYLSKRDTSGAKKKKKVAK